MVVDLDEELGTMCQFTLDDYECPYPLENRSVNILEKNEDGLDI